MKKFVLIVITIYIQIKKFLQNILKTIFYFEKLQEKYQFFKYDVNSNAVVLVKYQTGLILI